MSRNILQLNNIEAKKYFFRNENYSNIGLPKYFEFATLLKKVDTLISSKELSSLMNDKNKPSNIEGVNYTLINNKDGCYAWRPLQLINPVLYVELVNCITEFDNWNELVKRFKIFQKNKKIKCVSIPVIKSQEDENIKAEQISTWYTEFVQKSLELAIDYSYCFTTDISDCYGSIYTHSIAWAAMDKDIAKKNRNNKALLGNKIDYLIQSMSYGQTNGIPQGSVLMDFIAEIVLGYADLELTEKIKRNNINEYFILRYRDDYRIFVNNPQEGEKIIKLLTECLIELGLKLNPTKTLKNDDLIESALKQDKLYWIEHEHKQNDNQKQLLLLYLLSKKYPNAATLINELTDFFNKLKVNKNDNIKILINILTEIAYKNPSTYAIVASIVSIILSNVTSQRTKIAYIRGIIKKFSQRPNTGFLEIWLQRISYKTYQKFKFNENLCKLVQGKKVEIWDYSWITDKTLLSLIKKESIINEKVLNSMDSVVAKEEVNIFNKNVHAEHSQ